MGKRGKRRHKRRYLLTAAALSAGTMLLGCGSRQDDGSGGAVPLPGNPKGEIYPDDFYDAAGPEPQIDMPVDAGVAPAPPDAAEEPEMIPLPGNPKGSLYVDDVYPDDRD